MRLKQKSTLITGAGSGIGRATALLFAREGARVGVSDIDERAARTVAAEIEREGGCGSPYCHDVRDETNWEQVIAGIVKAWGGLDVLVANAGISFARSVVDMTLEEWRDVHAVNLEGAFLGTKHAIRAMRAGSRAGSIVIVSSASGLKASAGASAYVSSKAAVRMFARTAALECAADQIRVNTVHPAGVRTPMWESMSFFRDLKATQGEAAAWDALARGTPMGRFATADEVAAGILFLASDESSYVTGTELLIDGGYTAL